MHLCAKISSGLFKNVDKMFLQIMYLIYMYKQDLALNNHTMVDMP